MKTKCDHKHQCDPSECTAKIQVNQIEQKAECSTPTVTIAYQKSETTNDYAVPFATSSKDNLLQEASQKRQKELCSLIPVPNDQFFKVPDETSIFPPQNCGKMTMKAFW